MLTENIVLNNNGNRKVKIKEQFPENEMLCLLSNSSSESIRVGKKAFNEQLSLIERPVVVLVKI